MASHFYVEQLAVLITRVSFYWDEECMWRGQCNRLERGELLKVEVFWVCTGHVNSLSYIKHGECERKWREIELNRQPGIPQALGPCWCWASLLRVLQSFLKAGWFSSICVPHGARLWSWQTHTSNSNRISCPLLKDPRGSVSLVSLLCGLLSSETCLWRGEWLPSSLPTFAAVRVKVPHISVSVPTGETAKRQWQNRLKSPKCQH